MSDYEDFETKNNPELESIKVTPNSKTSAKSQAVRKTRIQKSYRKKVESEWSQEQILKLIEEIEMRPSLWDAGCAEYKLPKKILWQEVANALHVTLNDCQGKWANLRITFKSNLEKYRKKKLAQAAGESIPITWKYFKPMMFLEPNRVLQSNQSTSSTELNSAVDDHSLLLDLGEEKVLSPSPRRSCQRRKRRTTQSTPSSSPSDATHELSLKEMTTLQSLQSMCSHPKNPSIALCDYMASELQNLRPEQAEFARSKLRHAFSQIMDESVLIPSSREKQMRQQCELKKIRSKAAKNRNY